MGITEELANVLAEVGSRYSAAALKIELERILSASRSSGATAPTLTRTESGLSTAALTASKASAIQVRSTRYEDGGQLAVGGTSQVRRVFDTELGRRCAAKLLRPEFGASTQARKRFVDEAKLMAQLEHPGVIPIYDLAWLDGGQPFYAMREVDGYTMSHAIQDVHAASGRQGWEPSPTGVTLHRLIEALRRVCDTVAYAHSRGIVHCDLKPANIMLGRFGEVYTLDFGIAKVLSGAAGATQQAAAADAGQEARARAGGVAGTPAYMSPEQAHADTAAVGPLSDVYGLGAVLYEILTGTPPYVGTSSSEIVQQARRSAPPLPAERSETNPDAPPIPPGLQSICARAMARDPGARYQSAEDLGQALAEWVDGTVQRDLGLRVASEADALMRSARESRQRAAELSQRAQTMLSPLPPFAPVVAKQAAWLLDDEARALEGDAARLEVAYVQKLYSALTRAPDLAEAHSRLADYYRDAHASSERARRWTEASLFEVSLRAHEHGRHSAYLRGAGRISLTTSPPDATIAIYKYELRNRRLVAESKDIVRAPLREHELDYGSYLLVLSHPDCAETRLPVYVSREQHWECRDPEDNVLPIVLPRTGALDADDVYVPPGWFVAGGDGEALNGLPQARLWLDGFVIRRYAVTNRQYVAFLNDLLRNDREQEALRYAPRERAGAPGQEGPLLCERDAEGGFVLTATAAGVALLPDVPVCMVDWHGAAAYAAWLARRDDLPWRLPGEMEWEKAARGVDGRCFPWGDFLDPSWCLMRLSHTQMGNAFLAPVTAHVDDVSPYGVHGMAGNARDWCFDAFQPSGPQIEAGRPLLSNGEDIQGPGAGGAHRLYRGGAWRDAERSCRAAFRDAPPAYFRDWDISFRVLRPFKP